MHLPHLRSWLRHTVTILLSAVVVALGGVFLDSRTGHLAPPAPQPEVVRRTRTRVRTPQPKDATILAPLPDALRPPALPSDLPRPLPTNSWWSGGVLEPWPAPLFAWPLVTRLQADGVVIDAPAPLVVPRAVVHSPRSPLRLYMPDVPLTRATVRSFGDWDVTFRVHGTERPAFDVTTAQGNPVVQITHASSLLSIALPPAALVEDLTCRAPCSAALHVHAGDVDYVLSVDEGRLSSQGGAILAHLDPNGILAIAVVARGSTPAQYPALALAPIADTRASYVMRDASAETTFRYPQETLVGIFPHQKAFLARTPGRRIGTYETVRGTVTLYRGREFVTSLPVLSPVPSLPVAASLRTDSAFRAKLASEIESAPRMAGDVYAAGKDVLRTAHLLEIAEGIGDGALMQAASGLLREKLADWCTYLPGEQERSLAYDRLRGGLIAIPPAFGSEHYNDHHFHAGYFLRAGVTLARIDPSFADAYGDCMDLLIRDIASPDRDDPSFPYLRVFDPYAGHSWANGLTLFADGSNQESTSEAIQAWHAIALWGRVTGNRMLEEHGLWLLSQETVSARTYWLLSERGARSLPRDFPHPLISILWGGKVDYATFFDPAPAAIHGIQFFPLSTSLLSVLDASVLDRLVIPTAREAGPGIWRSHLLLVGALRDATIAEEVLAPEAPIDPGYSRSYVTHWVRSLEELGPLVTSARTNGCYGAVFERSGHRVLVAYRFPQDGAGCAVADGRAGMWREVELTPGWNVISL